MKRIWTAGLLALATVLVAGCGNDNSLNVSQSTRVRVVNAAPDVSTVRVNVDGKTFDNLAYGKASDYQGIDAGQQEVQVRTVVGNQTVLDQTQAFTAGVDYTLLVAGKLSNLTPIIVTDDNARPPAGQAKFRAINTVAGGPTVDVYVTAPGADLTTTTPTLTSLSPGLPSSSTQVAAGSFQVRFTQAGSKTPLVDVGTLTFKDGDIQTAVMLAAPGGGAPFSALILLAAPKQ